MLPKVVCKFNIILVRIPTWQGVGGVDVFSG